MKAIGILAAIEGRGDGDGFALINPERMYFVVPPDACPDDQVALMQQAQQQEGVVVLGVIIDGGPTT